MHSWINLGQITETLVLRVYILYIEIAARCSKTKYIYMDEREQVVQLHHITVGPVY